MKNIAGNYYNKHESKNPITRVLMSLFHKRLFSLIAKTKASSALDCGCGEGRTTALIKKRFPSIKIKGSELEHSAIAVARKNNPHVSFHQESLYNLKKKNNSFDLVIATEVLEHLEHPIKAIRETKRVSRKWCIYTVPNEPLWRIANICRGAYLRDWGNTPGHIQHWSMRSFRQQLKPHFKDVKVVNTILWNMALCKK